MNEEVKEKFIEIQKLFTKMSHEIMCTTVSSFYIWHTLAFSRSEVENDKEIAEKNVKIINLYKDFFIPTEESHLHIFVINIMKFYDKDNRALSFDNLVKLIRKNEKYFTPDFLKSVNPYLIEIGVNVDDYTPVKEEDLSYIESIIDKHKDLISSLKDIRDKQFAHTDINYISGTFIPNQVEELLQDTQSIFNRLSTSFERSTTMWDHIKRDSIRDTKFLFENLERGEIVRLEENKKKLENYE